MNSGTRAEIVAYKIKRANDTFEEVEFLIKSNLLITAVNRLYYSCFYAVSALLINKQIYSKTHAGTKQMFGLHFVIPNIISKESGKFYTEIFELRQEGDYEDFIEYDKDEVLLLLPMARELIRQIEVVIVGNM